MIIPPDYLLVAFVVLLGACIQGAGGIGFALFAAPITAIFHPELVPGPMIVLGGSLSLMSAVREFRHIDFPAVGYAVAGRLPASIAAGLVIGLLPMAWFSVVFGVLILAAIVVSLSGWRVQPTPRALFIGGLASGFMGTITSVGTPPMGIVMQNMEPARLRATVGTFIVIGTFISLAVLYGAGRFGMREIELSLLLFVPLTIGFWISSWLVKLINQRLMRKLVLGLSALSALTLLVQHAR